MSVHDSDLQAAVDSTSIAKDTGETDLVQYLRDQLAERDIETKDEAWLQPHGRADQGRPELHDRQRAERLRPGPPRAGRRALSRDAGSVGGSEWCTNPGCPSNHALTGLRRVGVNDYTCTECGEALRTPMSVVLAHRRTHARLARRTP